MSLNKVVHEVFLLVVEPPDLLPLNRISPPALKKCLAAFEVAKVIVIVWLTTPFHDVARVWPAPARVSAVP